MTIHRQMTLADGDTVVADFSPDDAEAVAKAMDQFHKIIGQGYWAASLGSDGEKKALVREFDPHMDIMFMPQFVGG